MTHFDYLIIGGGIAGTTAAEAIRTKDQNASIAVIGSEPHLLYSRVLLPHFVRGRITEDKVFLKKTAWAEEKHIVYLTGTSVTGIDTKERRAVLSDGSVRTWGKLLIATGGSPRKLECPGASDDTCMHFQYLEDARALAAVSAGPAMTVGGGFIALEFLMSFAVRGIDNFAVLRGKSYFSRSLDEASAGLVRGALERHGVRIVTETSVRAIESSGPRKTAFLTNGERIDCAAIGVGVGIRPNVGFLAGSGIDVRDGIVVDEKLRASAADVYAAGDVAEYLDPLVAEHHVIGNWTNATLQGKRAGLNMSGEEVGYDQLTSYSINCFDLPLAFLGATDIPADGSIVRRHPDGEVLQLRLRQGRIIAATSAGPFIDRAAVTKLITGRQILDEKAKKAASDPSVSLASLVV